MRGSERQGSQRVGRIYRKLYAHGFAQAVLEMGEVQTTARTFGLEVTQLEIGKAAIAPAFETRNGKADALYVVDDALVTANRSRIITLALGARLPAIFNNFCPMA